MGRIVVRAYLALLSRPDGALAAVALRPGLAPAVDLPHDSKLPLLMQQLPCCLYPADQQLFDSDSWAALNAQGLVCPAEAELATPASPEELSVSASARYLTGDWYLQPLARPVKELAGSRALALKLLELVGAEADTRDIEEIFRRDPALSYQLLRLVNSPGISAGRRIDSFAQAILVLGRRQLKRWLNLLLFMPRKEDPRSSMLLARVVLRARLLELLVRESGADRDAQERAFMAGMFSLLGPMFGQPLAEVLKPLGLEPGLQAALLERTGDLGALLNAVEALEGGQLRQVVALLEPRLPGDLALDALMIEACLWMLELTGEGGAHG